MKTKNLILTLATFAVATFGYQEIALSGSTQVSSLMANGMPAQLATTVDAFYSSSIPVAPVYQTGINRQLAVYVPTAAATPVAGTNLIKPGLNVVPTNAANNAMFIGAATPVAGQEFIVVNNAGAAVRLKASGGATLNGATAGGWISVASLATVHCFTASTANQVCLQPVIPTPQ